jgi:hypothetical protein
VPSTTMSMVPKPTVATTVGGVPGLDSFQ